jgi:hypothetical protein
MSLPTTRRLVAIAAVGMLSLGVSAGAAAAADTGGQREKERVSAASIIRLEQSREKERVASREKERVASREKERSTSREKERSTSREKERSTSREKE